MTFIDKDNNVIDMGNLTYIDLKVVLDELVELSNRVKALEELHRNPGKSPA